MYDAPIIRYAEEASEEEKDARGMRLITPQTNAAPRRMPAQMRTLIDIMASMPYLSGDDKTLYLFSQSLHLMLDLSLPGLSDTVKGLAVASSEQAGGGSAPSASLGLSFEDQLEIVKSCCSRIAQANDLIASGASAEALSSLETLENSLKQTGIVPKSAKGGNAIHRCFDTVLQRDIYMDMKSVKKTLQETRLPMARLYKSMGDALITMGDLDGALSNYSAARNWNPADISAVCSYAEAQRAKGNPDTALKSAQGGMDLAFTAADISVCHLVASRCLVDLGLVSEAAACVQISIWADPAEAQGDGVHGVADVIGAICKATGYGGDVILSLADDGLETDKMPRRSAESIQALRRNWQYAMERGDVYEKMTAFDALGLATGSLELCEEASRMLAVEQAAASAQAEREAAAREQERIAQEMEQVRENNRLANRILDRETRRRLREERRRNRR